MIHFHFFKRISGFLFLRQRRIRLWRKRQLGLILLIFLYGCSASDSWKWVRQGGGETYDAGRGIALDPSGNIYVAGRFQSTSMFNGNTLEGKGDDEIFLLKYQPDGTLLWATKAGGSKEDVGYAISVDAEGNSFITGHFSDTADFDNIQLVSSGESDIFVAKYDPDGKAIWAKRAGGIFEDIGRSIAVDKQGNCYVTGFFLGAIRFDSLQLASSHHFEDIFIAKYDPSGNLLWAKRAGGTDNDRAMVIAAGEKGDFFITGFFVNTAGFDSITLTSAGKADIFVAKYDNNGNALWARPSGGIGWDEGNGIAIDGQTNVYVSGFFDKEAVFDNDDNEKKYFQSAGDRDVFTAKYNTTGELVWVKQAGGSSIDESRAVGVTTGGECFVTGFFSGKATFENDSLASRGNSDIFVAHYDSNGELIWVEQAGGNEYDEARAVVPDESGNIYLTGDFNGNPLFGTIKLDNSRDVDVFIAKLTDIHPVSR